MFAPSLVLVPRVAVALLGVPVGPAQPPGPPTAGSEQNLEQIRPCPARSGWWRLSRAGPSSRSLMKTLTMTDPVLSAGEHHELQDSN